MEYLAYGLATVLIFYALGLGLTLWILPAELRQYSLIIAPWVGYWYLSLACLSLYEFGGAITGTAAQIILLLPVLCLVVALVTKGPVGILSGIFSNRRVLGALGLAGGGFLFFSIPLLSEGRGLTTVSLFNHDVASYAIVTRFFTDFTRTSSAGVVGQGIAFYHKMADEGYFGPCAFVGFLGSPLGVMPHQTITLCINLFAALGVASLFLFLYDILKVRPKVAYLGIALFAFHPAL